MRLLVDTSVWIDHLRRPTPRVLQLLALDEVIMHPFVLGEIACGHVSRREAVLQQLVELPQAQVARDVEVLTYIERHGLMGRGVGYIDVHLLASVALVAGDSLLTRDRRLAAVARDLGLAAPDPG